MAAAELEAWRAGRMAALATCVAWIALSAFTLVSVGWALAIGLLVAVRRFSWEPRER